MRIEPTKSMMTPGQKPKITKSKGQSPVTVFAFQTGSNDSQLHKVAREVLKTK